MRPIVGIVALALPSCGPSVAQLVAQHQIVPAFCRASNEREAAMVIPPLLASIAPEWRMRRVLRDDLPTLDETLAKDIFDHHVLLIVETRARPPATLRVRGIDFLASFPTENASSDRVVGVVAAPLSPAEFASLTGEGVPDPKVVTETKLAHPESAIPWAIVTLGASLLFAEHKTTTETKYPTDAELRAAAPRSAALYDALLAKFGRAPIVAVRRGEGTRHFRVERELLIDNETSDGCSSRLRVNVHGATFTLDETFDAEWQPFDVRAWTGAGFEPSGGRELITVGH